MAEHFGDAVARLIAKEGWVRIHNALIQCDREMTDEDDWGDLLECTCDFLEAYHGAAKGPALEKAIEIVAEREGFIELGE
jgi:hypothetical protein